MGKSKKMTAKQPYKIGIVLDRKFGSKLIELSKTMHVWVCNSPVNLKVVKVVNERTHSEVSSIESGITTFQISEGESSENMFLNIIDTVDLHHGEFSHDPPWSVLCVFGTKLSPTIEAKLKDFGKGEVKEEKDGFIFYRNL